MRAVLKGSIEPNEGLKQSLRDLVRKTLGRIVIVSHIYFVNKLPTTRSGKVMRRVIRGIITNRPLGDYWSIEDETTIEELKKASHRQSWFRIILSFARISHWSRY